MKGQTPFERSPFGPTAAFIWAIIARMYAAKKGLLTWK